MKLKRRNGDGVMRRFAEQDEFFNTMRELADEIIVYANRGDRPRASTAEEILAENQRVKNLDVAHPGE